MGTDPDCGTWLHGTGGPDLSECMELWAQANGRVGTLLLCRRQGTLEKQSQGVPSCHLGDG